MAYKSILAQQQSSPEIEGSVPTFSTSSGASGAAPDSSTKSTNKNLSVLLTNNVDDQDNEFSSSSPPPPSPPPPPPAHTFYQRVVEKHRLCQFPMSDWQIHSPESNKALAVPAKWDVHDPDWCGIVLQRLLEGSTTSAKHENDNRLARLDWGSQSLKARPFTRGMVATLQRERWGLDAFSIATSTNGQSAVCTMRGSPKTEVRSHSGGLVTLAFGLRCVLEQRSQSVSFF